MSLARPLGRARGLTLLELVVAMALLTVFLALTHEALRDVFLYPQQSLRRFSDRSEAMTVERFLVESMKSAEEGYIWSKSDDSGVRVLMGLAREFRKVDESPVTEYVLFSYHKSSHSMMRWHLTPEQVATASGGVRPNRDLPDHAWEALMRVDKGSPAAKHMVNFVFELGPEEEPAHLVIEVNSGPRTATGEFLEPSREINRKLSKVRDEKK